MDNIREGNRLAVGGTSVVAMFLPIFKLSDVVSNSKYSAASLHTRRA